MNSWKSIAILASGALANNGCSIDQSVLEPRPFHKGWTFHGCDAQTDENSVVPSGTTCKQVWCNQFKFSKAYNVECRDGAWSELPTCFKGCPAPTSKAGYQFVGCRKNMGNGTLNTKDGTKIMTEPFSTLHNRDAEKSNAHRPKKNLLNHFPKKTNNPFTKSTRTRHLDLNVTAMSRENVSGFISMTNHMVLI